MNMNFVRFHFDASSQKMLALSLEKNLVDAIDAFLARIGDGVRATLYKMDEFTAYTLILWAASGSERSLSLETFTRFLRSELVGIGQRVPRSWKRQSGSRAQWKRSS